MPIQIQSASSMLEVEQDIRSLEAQYKMSSDDFCAHPTVSEVVPEFDAIEWNFLLMQKRAMQEDACSAGNVFQAQSATQISNVDTSSILDKIAA